MNKILDRVIEDGENTIIVRLESANVQIRLSGNDCLWIDIGGRPACQIDLFHMSDDNEDGERYAQVVLESEHGEDPVGYLRLLNQGNLVVFEPGAKKKSVEWDDGEYYG